MKEKNPSYISDARRTQIINAAITTLGEIGYVRASLAQIAQRAGISTALISYHFRDKPDLMDHTLAILLRDNALFVSERTKAGKNCRERLHLFIRSGLEYQERHPEHFIALLEIVFNARTSEDIPYYRISDADGEDTLLTELRNILYEGQKTGEFRNFNVRVMADTIQGAIGEFASPNTAGKPDAATYGGELTKIFDRAVVHDRKNAENT